MAPLHSIVVGLFAGKLIIIGLIFNADGLRPFHYSLKSYKSE